MPNPHRFLRTILYVLTPIAYGLAIGYHLANTMRDAFRKGAR